MAAEVGARVLALDFSFVIRDGIEQPMCHRFEIKELVDSRGLFNVVAKDETTAEHRLLADFMALKKSYHF